MKIFLNVSKENVYQNKSKKNFVDDIFQTFFFWKFNNFIFDLLKSNIFPGELLTRTDPKPILRGLSDILDVEVPYADSLPPFPSQFFHL